MSLGNRRLVSILAASNRWWYWGTSPRSIGETPFFVKTDTLLAYRMLCENYRFDTQRQES